jgi:hypothetical protein
MYIHDLIELLPPSTAKRFAKKLRTAANLWEDSWDKTYQHYTIPFHECSDDENVWRALANSWNDCMAFCDEVLGEG